jgi:modulator of FtsH protease
MGDWTSFFASELQAAAALTGLIIVGISINVARIIAVPGLAGRAAETLVLPTGILVACSFALVPGQPAGVLGIEIGLTGLVMWLIPTFIHVQALRTGNALGPARGTPRVVLAMLASWAFIASGVLLVLHSEGALYWAVAGVLVSLVVTVVNAWVVLIEILR